MTNAIKAPKTKLKKEGSNSKKAATPAVPDARSAILVHQ